MALITEVIKYEGDNNTFIWKHPSEDFNNMTQLIVHESQEAVFFMNGQALDLFGAGRHTLETESIPILSRAINRIVGNDSPFHCEVYFINKTVQMAMKWGTDSKIRFIEPESGVPMEIGACGEMNLQVCDSRKLLLKLVGTTNGIAWDSGDGFTQSIKASFRPLISTAVKSNLTRAIKESNINILEVDEHLEELSDKLRSCIISGFEEYGLTIPQFYVSTIVLPEDDANFKRIKELHTISLQQRMIRAEGQVRSTQAFVNADVTAAERQVELERQTTQTEIAKREAERRLIEAQAQENAMKLEGFAEAEIMRAKGYNQKDVIEADVRKAFAEGMGNMGSGGGTGGSAMSDIVGLGVGLQAASAMSGQIGDIFKGFGNTAPQNNAVSQNPAPTNEILCSKCGNKLPEGAKFCLECGAKVEILAENEMICSACGKKTPKGKFCMECGSPLIRRCAKCNAEIPQGAKFCLECGEKL